MKVLITCFVGVEVTVRPLSPILKPVSVPLSPCFQSVHSFSTKTKLALKVGSPLKQKQKQVDQRRKTQVKKTRKLEFS